MPLYELTKSGIDPIATTTFSKEGIAERQDLQRLLRHRIEVLGDDLLVIAEEFGNWDDSKRRIDLLAIDRHGVLVVIELKRSDDGGHVELQAIRYAAMISTMTMEQAIDAFGTFLRAHGIQDDPQARMLEFLGWDEPDEEQFGQEVRIVLVAGDFSKEVMTSVLWLREYDIEIRCVRLQPYKLGDRVVVDAEQVIPLKEAEDFRIHVRAKQEKERMARQQKKQPWSGIWYVNIADGKHRSWEDCRRYGFVAAGQGPAYSEPLKKLNPGDRLYVYQKGAGYLAAGVVKDRAVMAKDFAVEGKPLFDLSLKQPGIKTNADDPALSEWVVRVQWSKALDMKEAKRFEGAFANQNVVCKLRDAKTLEFLAAEIGTP